MLEKYNYFTSKIKETEDHQQHTFDSDDEYESVKQSMGPKETIEEEAVACLENPYGDAKQPLFDEMQSYSNARNILKSMKKQENQSHREWQVEKKLNSFFQT